MLRPVARALLFLCLFPATAAAQDLRVFVVTVGPGELAYERFGHNALLFIDESTGRSVAYDWGRFDFKQPNFIGRFIRGDMLYSSGAGDGDETLAFYESLGRRIDLQEFSLSPEEAAALLRACERGYLPENREYRYDYFVANCSTKLRDVIDETLGGQVRAQLQGTPTGVTWRSEAERHVAEDWPLWAGIHVGLGRPADRGIDAWEQTFLPAELRDWLRTVQITGSDGQSVPLVAREIVLTEGRLPLAPAAPPSRWWAGGLLGLILAAGMLLLSSLRRPLPARLAASLWLLIAGIAGCFFLLIWAFSGHWAGYANQSVLLLSPLGLPLAVTTLRQRRPRLTWWLAAVHLGLCVLGALLHLTPAGQANAAVVCLALPLNVAATWVATSGWRGQSESALEVAPAV